MEFLNWLLFCLLINGISSNKYYYKRIGNRFDVIFGPRAIGDYQELKPPKSIKMHYDMRGDRPGECIDRQFLCRIPYQRSMTEHFECIFDYQCPRFHKCCQLKCFLHKVCQPAFGADFFTTVRSTAYKQISTSTETEKTTVESIITQPPEPLPQINLDTGTSNDSPSPEPSESTKSTKITTREPERDISPTITTLLTPTSGGTRGTRGWSPPKLTTRMSSIEESHIIELDSTVTGKENITKITSEEPASRSTSTESTEAIAGITNNITKTASTVMTTEGHSISKYSPNIEINTPIETRELKSVTNPTRSPNFKRTNITENASPEIKNETTTEIFINKTESPTNIGINTPTESINPTTGSITRAIDISSVKVTGASTESTEAIAGISNNISKIASTVMTTEGHSISKYSPNIEINTPIETRELITVTNPTRSPNFKRTNITENASPEIKDETTTRIFINKTESPTNIGINTPTESINPTTSSITRAIDISSVQVTMEVPSIKESSAINITSAAIFKKDTKYTEIATISPLVETETSSNTEISVSPIKRYETSSIETETPTKPIISRSSFTESYETTQTSTSMKARPETQTKSSVGTGIYITSDSIEKTIESEPTDTGLTTEIIWNKFSKPESTSQIGTSSETEQQTPNEYATKYRATISSEFNLSGNVDISAKNVTNVSDEIQVTNTCETEISETSTITTSSYETISKETVTSKENTSTRETDFSLITEKSPTSATIHIKESPRQLQGSPQNRKASTIKTQFSELSIPHSKLTSENFTTNYTLHTTKQAPASSQVSSTTMYTSSFSAALHVNEIISETTTPTETLPDISRAILGIQRSVSQVLVNVTSSLYKGKNWFGIYPNIKPILQSSSTISTEISSSKLQSTTISNIEPSTKITTDERRNVNISSTNHGDRSNKPDKTPKKGSELQKNATTKAETFEDDEDMMMGSGFGSGDGSSNDSEDDTEPGGSDKPDKTLQKGSELHKNARTPAGTFEDDEDMIKWVFGGGDSSGNGSDDNTEATVSEYPNKTDRTGLELLNKSNEFTTMSPKVEVETMTPTTTKMNTFREYLNQTADINDETIQISSTVKTNEIPEISTSTKLKDETTTEIVTNEIQSHTSTTESIIQSINNETTEMSLTELTRQVEESSATTMTSITIVGKNQRTSTNIESISEVPEVTLFPNTKPFVQGNSTTTTELSSSKSQITIDSSSEYGIKTDQFTKMAIDEERKLNIPSTDPGDRSDEINFTGFTKVTKVIGSDKPDKTPQKELERHENPIFTVDPFEDDEDMMGSGFGSGDGSVNSSDYDMEAAGGDKTGKTPHEGNELEKNSTATFEEDVGII